MIGARPYSGKICCSSGDVERSKENFLAPRISIIFLIECSVKCIWVRRSFLKSIGPVVRSARVFVISYSFAAFELSAAIIVLLHAFGGGDAKRMLAAEKRIIR